MKHRRTLSLVVAPMLLALAYLSACDAGHIGAPLAPTATTTLHGNADRGSGRGDPDFLMASLTAPTIANPVITFWAKRGVDQSVRMYYHARHGHNDSTTFLVFRVRQKSLVTRVDGTSLANGDSVLITLTLIDPARLIVDFQPAGLRFAASDPASLKMSFGEAAQDFNGDGVVNSQDTAFSAGFKIWRRESLFDPWIAVPSLVAEKGEEVTADIGGFTSYAVAY